MLLDVASFEPGGFTAEAGCADCKFAKLCAASICAGVRGVEVESFGDEEAGAENRRRAALNVLGV